MFNWFKKTPQEDKREEVKPRGSFLSADGLEKVASPHAVGDVLAGIASTQVRPVSAGAMDDSSNGAPTLKVLNNGVTTMSEALADWYASQGFIGHQLAALISQNWLINKACSMPARDAVRKGYVIASVDGDDLEDEAAKLLKRYDRAYKLNHHLEEFVRKGRIFGIRIALFKVESTDPLYYEKPFNPDGITPGSYKGIVQVDPYWCAPMLDEAAASRPDSLHFYEPTWWMINGKKHHRSHLVIYRNAQPVDILRPQYLYGGVPVPQQIMERVYAAERVANEAPQLAQTKRTNIWKTDMETVMANPDKALERLNTWSYYRDNYGVKLGDKEGDEFQQFDTSLADLDTVIMTQYQIVAAAANVPATKLLGTTPKGFNSTGEYEEASYHEELESIQTHDLTPLVERHHMLVMRSFVAPKLNMEPIETVVVWNALDSPTAKELADTNLVKAQTGQTLIAAGVIASEDERQRIATDKFSGYNELGLDEGGGILEELAEAFGGEEEQEDPAELEEPKPKEQKPAVAKDEAPAELIRRSNKWVVKRGGDVIATYPASMSKRQILERHN